MRVDRETFLWLATALAACHARESRVAEPVEPAQAPPEVQLAAPEPESIADAGATVAEDASAPDGAPPDVAPPPPPPPVVKTAAELRRICGSLKEPNQGCPKLRAQMCQVAFTEFTPAPATQAVTCLAELESSCDVCGIRVCMKGALEGLPAMTVSECESVAREAEKLSEGYGEQMKELCVTYASGMTAKGRARFAACLKKNPGVGVRFCLWDPSVTPCTEGGQSPPPVWE